MNVGVEEREAGPGVRRALAGSPQTNEVDHMA